MALPPLELFSLRRELPCCRAALSVFGPPIFIGFVIPSLFDFVARLSPFHCAPKESHRLGLLGVEDDIEEQ